MTRHSSKLFLAVTASAATLAAALLFAPGASAVGTRRFVLDKAADFDGGDLKAVSIDSAGGVRAGLDLGKLEITDAAMVWTALSRKDSVLLGTGSDGKVLEVRGGKATTLAETKLLVVTSLVESNGKLLAAGMGKGAVLEIANGKVTEFAKLPDAEHVFDMAVDPKTGDVLAATGPKGKLFRISRAGAAQVLFDAEEEHLMSVAVSADGRVYTGAGDKAKLYEVTGPGRASVLYDFNRTEVRKIVVGPKGDVYAIANQISGSGSGPWFGGMMGAGGRGGRASKSSGRGVLFRFSPTGTPEELFDLGGEHFTALALEGGVPHVGTGVNGKVYAVDENHNSVVVADVEERQVAALALSGAQRFVVGSDPVVFRPVRGVGGADAVWSSKVLDAGIRARFGKLDFVADGQLELQTRSGNTEKPDDTWSAWSAGLTAPGPVKSGPARYLQIRARWTRDAKAVLRSVNVSFLTDNLRAVLRDVTATSPASPTGSTGVAASGGTPSKGGTTLNVNWRVDNPDQDELRYRVFYRMVGTTTWLDMLKPKERLRSTSTSWDVSNLPEGRYRLRVEVSDELSNPPELVKKHELESNVVLVDTSAPAFTVLRAAGKRIQGTVTDGVGPIARIEVAPAGTEDWIPFHPKDGIFDADREDFDADVSGMLTAGAENLLIVRAYDLAGNSIVRNVVVK